MPPTPALQGAWPRGRHGAPVARFAVVDQGLRSDADFVAAEQTVERLRDSFVDYFQRLTLQGGHMSFLPDERRKLEAEGWDAQRIADLQTIIAILREGKNVPKQSQPKQEVTESVQKVSEKPLQEPPSPQLEFDFDADLDI